jgi:predicted methyltransferase
VRAAGFELAGEGDFLRSSTDSRTATVFDPSITGNTDQFVLRFVKPADLLLGSDRELSPAEWYE